MCNPAAILARCRDTGLRLYRAKDKLVIKPAKLCSPELLAQIRAHKPALLLLLEAEATRLTPDCGPWLHIARQIMAGEFDGGDRSSLDALVIGVRNIAHPTCRQARTRLELLLGRSRKEARR